MTHTSDERTPAGTAREEARSVGDEIREKGAEAARAARETARGYAEQARDEAYARGEAYRDYAANETSKVAAALRRASEDLNSGSPQERFIGQIADGIADAADRMRGMSLDDIGRDTQEFARRHPAAFLGGAALAGFAVARFLKASAHRDEPLYLDSPRGSSVEPSSEPIPSPSTRSPGALEGTGTPRTSTGGAATGSGAGGMSSAGASSSPGGSFPSSGGTTSPGGTPPSSGSTPGTGSSSPAGGSSSSSGSSSTPSSPQRPGDNERS